MKDIPIRDRIILALDVSTPELARELVRRTESRLGFYKVGLQLFMADWFNTVDWLVARGHKVMVDLKFFDIPETVHLAVRQLLSRRVSLATVHGNDAIVAAAMRAVRDREAEESLKILAVTVLTSFGEGDLRALGMTGSIEELVYLRAKRALEMGCDGVVSSGLEAANLRAQLGERLLIVTPGIRPGANLPADDQTRVMSAGAAIRAGADQVVVGRPIAKAEEPLLVIDQMQAEIAAALAGGEV